MIDLMTFLTSGTTASFLVLLVIKSGLVAALGLLAWRLLYKLSASARHVVLSGALLAIILLPAVGYFAPPLTVTVAGLATIPVATDIQPELVTAPAPASIQRVTPVASVSAKGAAQTSDFRSADAVLAIYLCGVAAVLVHLLLGVGRVWRISRQSQDVDANGVWASSLKYVDGRRAAAPRAQVKTSSQITSPMMWGAVTPIILMPLRASQWSESDRRNALLHEMAHVDRGDWLTQMLARVACAVNWFNPLVWVASRLLNTEAEHAADDRVLSSGSRPDDYAEQLVALTRVASGSGRFAAAALPMANARLLKRRVAAVLNTGENRMPLPQFTRYALFGGIAMVALVIAALLPVAAASGRGDALESTPRQARELTPLHEAAAAGDHVAVANLIEAGANVKATLSRSFGSYQRTVLGTAARGGHLQVAELLIDAGADVDRVRRGDATALIEALRGRHTEMAQLLVARGADVNHVVRGDGSPLISAVATGNAEAVRFLLDQGADPNRRVRGDENPLYHAARSGDVEVLRMLIAADVDVNQKMRGDGNALIVAIRGGNADAADVLIEAGARADQGVRGDGNALISAAGRGDLDLLRKMIATGANVNAAVAGDGSPLIAASRNRQLAAAQLLVDNGANVNQFVMGDETALIGAAWGGNIDMVNYLLSVGADPAYLARTPEGTARSALSQATLAGHDDVVRILKSAGARE